MADINDKSNTLLSGTSGDDYIHNGGGWLDENGDYTKYDGGSNVTIDAGAGNDYVWNDDGDSVTIDAGAGNDSVYNYEGDSVTIDTGAGKDSVVNDGGSNVTIDTGAGNDNVRNYSDSDSVTINTGAGNDYVTNDGSRVTINTGEDKDSVQNNGDSVTINTGEGNDDVLNYGDSVTINTGEGNDSVRNYYGDSVTITGGKGNDEIFNHCYLAYDGSIYYYDDDYGSNVLFKYAEGDGNDIIYGFKADSTLSISGGAYSSTKSGDDVIVTVGNGKISLIGAADYFSSSNLVFKKTSTGKKLKSSAENTSLVGGTGNDSLYIGHNSVTASGSSGNDTIKNTRPDAKIYGGDGADTIINTKTGEDWSLAGSFCFIDAGNGNDSIFTDGYGDYVTVKCGDGDDTIYNYSGWSVFDGGKGNDYISLNGWSDNSVNGGDGNDYINNFGTRTTILGGAGNDSIYNSHGDDFTDIKNGCNVSINGGDGNDLVFSGGYDGSIFYGGKVSIYGEGGADSIWNYEGGDTVIIDGGADNDYISNSGALVTVYGGAGNDSIFSGLSASINGGAGNDLISLNSDSGLQIGTQNNISGKGNTVKGGKGNDSIYGNNSIGSSIYGAIYQYNLGDGNDKIYNFGKTDTLSISGGSYSTTTSGDNVIVTVGDEKISLMGAASLEAVNIKGTKANEWTISGTTAKYGTTSKTLVTVKGLKSGLKASNGKISGISLSGKVITLSESVLDTSKVTVSDGYTLKLADDVTKRTTKPATWSYSNGTATYKSSYKTAGYLLSSNAKSISYYSKATTATTLASVKGAKAKPTISNDVIKLKTSTINSKVTLSGSYEFDFASGDYKKTKVLGSSSADKITSHGKNISLNGGKGNDTIKVYGSATSVKGGAGSDVFVFDGGSGVITDYAAEDKISIASGTVDATTSGDNVIFTVGSKKITVKGGKDKKITYIENGETKIYPSGDDEKIITLNEDHDEEIYTFGSKLRTLDASAVQLALNITGNNYMNSIIGGLDDDTIDGGGAADTINGGVGNDSIFGGKGNDILTGGKGDDTLKGGSGSDVFVYSKGDGKDVIEDYTADEDIISIASGKADIKTSGKNVIFTVGTGKITVKGGKSQVIAYSDDNGSDLYYFNMVNIDGTKKIAKLSSSYSQTKFDVADFAEITEIKTIDASAVHSGLRITGSGRNESIIGGYGDDTIIGGKGDDTLQGNNGKDYFRYSYNDGDDVIKDYEEGDVIQIMSGQVSDNVIVDDNRDVLFQIVGGGSIRVQKGKGKEITFVNKDDVVTSSRPYTVSLMQDATWFTEDDTNFNTSQLDSIIKNSLAAYSFGELELTTPPLTEDKTLITYTGKK